MTLASFTAQASEAGPEIWRNKNEIEQVHSQGQNLSVNRAWIFSFFLSESRATAGWGAAGVGGGHTLWNKRQGSFGTTMRPPDSDLGQQETRLHWTMAKGPDSSGGRASDSKPRRNTDAGSSPRCDKGFFSHSQHSVQTRLRCSYPPPPNPVQSHASTYVRTFQIPHTDSHTIVWTHENITHTEMNG